MYYPIIKSTIELRNIKVYAYHGCLKEETLAGSDYLVNLSAIVNDVSKSAYSDSLADTVDYVLLNNIVKEEMKVPSKLLENVAHRIMTRIFDQTIEVEEVTISVSKLNPPIGGDVESVSVTICSKRF